MPYTVLSASHHFIHFMLYPLYEASTTNLKIGNRYLKFSPSKATLGLHSFPHPSPHLSLGS